MSSLKYLTANKRQLGKVLKRDFSLLPLFAEIEGEVGGIALTKFLAHSLWYAFEVYAKENGQSIEEVAREYLFKGPEIASGVSAALLETGQDPEKLLDGMDTARAIIGAQLARDTKNLKRLSGEATMGTYVEFHAALKDYLSRAGAPFGSPLYAKHASKIMSSFKRW